MYTSRRLWPAAVLAAGALTLAACSSSGSSSESSAAPASSEAAAASEAPASEAPADAAVSADVIANVEAAKALPAFTAPGAAFDITDVAGKKIFEIPSVPNPFLQSISDSMKQAAEAAGAIYTVCDNQAEVSQWVACMDQAVNSDQDIILLNGAPDPRALQPQIQAAKDAGIPVTVIHFHDDSNPAPPTCEGCENVTAVVTAPFNVAGKAAADWIIADSGGTANTLIVGGSDILPSPATIDTMTKEFDENCAGCEYTVINIPVADWNTKTQTEIQAALQANPDINYVYVLYDAMVAGAVPAVETLGRTDVKIGSYNGSPFALDFIAQGDTVAFNVGEDTPGIGYAAIDQAFRILTGNEVVQTRTPIRIWDDTNVAEAGTPAQPGAGYGDAYVAGYQSLWTTS
ncbi:MAG: sugar ABC transporter substrate-binding protein [Actinomycetota bacterium]|nr:sugar ABC transporter substrate-binding protein [Actinomycetota bacterium]